MSADVPDLSAALTAAIAAAEEINPRIRLDYCPACKGSGRILAGGSGLGLYGLHWVECWDCGGTGDGDPTEEKDISHDD